MVGSFLPSYQIEQKTKKPRYESPSISMQAAAIPTPNNDADETYGTSGHGQQSSTPKPSLAPSASFRGDSWSAPLHPAPEPRNSNTDINISLPGQWAHDSRTPILLLTCEVSYWPKLCFSCLSLAAYICSSTKWIQYLPVVLTSSVWLTTIGVWLSPYGGDLRFFSFLLWMNSY